MRVVMPGGMCIKYAMASATAMESGMYSSTVGCDVAAAVRCMVCEWCVNGV